MTKLLVHLAFIIYCGGQAANQNAAMQGGRGMQLTFFVTVITSKTLEIINYNTTDYLIWQSCWYILLSSFIVVAKLPTKMQRCKLEMVCILSFLSQVCAEINTDYKIDELWNDGSLIQTTQVEESTLLNCGRMEDGIVSILEEKPLLFVRNTLNLIK
ncbi:unnamed protein product [Wuchereria bancrofti]|uniref:Uncharacterized protein n=1 Tax=Wuchereria bancrofti TaxID=6293 RepID=A0A3P7E2C5_WUCBA|nr:unnamed protein product [Wuchereria bancrofti]